MKKRKVEFDAADKKAVLYQAEKEDAPLIIFNNFSGDGSGVVREMENIQCGDCNLLSIGNLKWDHDMTPWYCLPLSEDDTPCTGGADEYLKILLNDILPQALSKVEGTPEFLGLAGYSLAGLFAVYAMHLTDRFSRIASMSGSLWFPDFTEYAMTHPLQIKPDHIYLSLGDEEAKVPHPLLKTVQKNTEALFHFYRNMGIEADFELNEGNHYQNAALRSAKGIAAIVSQ